MTGVQTCALPIWYYLKPNDVKLSILEEGHNGYTGQYIAVLSKDMQGDPMEIKVLWY